MCSRQISQNSKATARAGPFDFRKTEQTMNEINNPSLQTQKSGMPQRTLRQRIFGKSKIWIFPFLESDITLPRAKAALISRNLASRFISGDYLLGKKSRTVMIPSSFVDEVVRLALEKVSDKNVVCRDFLQGIAMGKVSQRYGIL